MSRAPKWKACIGKTFNNLTVISRYITNKRGIYFACVCDCGKQTVVRHSALVSGSTKSCGCYRSSFKRPDYTNSVFGYLTAQKYSEVHKAWECFCKCGKIIFVKTNSLTTGNTTSCGCKRTESLIDRNVANKQYQNYKDIDGQYYARILTGARQRKLPFEISIQDMYDILFRQNFICALSGLKLECDFSNMTASLDRIDSQKGYTLSNIQWLHKDVNSIKLDYKQWYFVYICFRIANFRDYVFDDRLIRVKNHSGPWTGVGNLSGGFFTSIRRGAKQRGLGFSVNKRQLWSLFLSQQGRCNLTGLKIKLDHRFDRKFQTASLDRIDSNGGYEISNVRWVHKDVNRMRMNMDNKRFLELCDMISEYNNV